jgi:WD40 repeat protein
MQKRSTTLMKWISNTVFLTALTFVLGSPLPVTAQIKEPSKEPILRLEASMHTARITHLSIDRASKYLVTASLDRTIRIWDASSAALIRTVRVPLGPEPEGRLNAVAISPDGSTVAATGLTGVTWDQAPCIYLIDRESGQIVRRLSALPGLVISMAFSPDGKFLLANLISGGTQFYRTSDYATVATESDFNGLCAGISFDRDGRFATTCMDGNVRVYDLRIPGFKPTLTKRVDGGLQPISAVFSDNGKMIAVGFADSQKVAVVSGTDLSPVSTVDAPGLITNRLNMLAWSADGKYLFGGGTMRGEGGRQIVRSWTAGDWLNYRDTLLDSSETINDLESASDGRIFFTTMDPAFGAIDAKGKVALFQPAAILDLRGQFQAFRVAPDGSGVSFSYEPFGNALATFSLADRELRQVSSIPSNWRPPAIAAAGLKINNWLNSYGTDVNGLPLPLEPGEMTRCVAIAPDGSSFIIGTEYGIRLFDRSGVQRWQGGFATAWSVNLSADGRFAVAAFADGTIRWFNASDGTEILAFYPHTDRKRWVAWNNQGYYDSSPGAEDLLGWQVNNGKDRVAEFYPIGQFFEKYYHPKLTEQALSPTGVQPPNPLDRSAAGVAKTLRPPPQVRIITPADHLTVTTEAVKVTVETTDLGGGIDEVRLYHNEKLIQDDSRQLVQGSSNSRSYNVTLVPGANAIRAVAFNRDRTQSSPAAINIDYRGNGASADLYILAVGLNEYKNNNYNLNYGRADATALAEGIEQHAKGIFAHVNKQVLLDGQATRKSIEAAFAKIIAQAKPQDAFVFYFAGHGTMSDGTAEAPSKFYLVPYDVTQLYGDDGALATSGVSADLMSDECTKVKALKQLIIFDACQSAGALASFTTAGNRGAIEEKAISQLARSTGVVVLAATGQDQVAMEFKKLGHGVFTYALLQGLNGEADGGSSPDGKITASEIVAFINDRVPDLTKQYRGKTQYPNAWIRGQDFPLGVK